MTAGDRRRPNIKANECLGEGLYITLELIRKLEIPRVKCLTDMGYGHV